MSAPARHYAQALAREAQAAMGVADYLAQAATEALDVLLEMVGGDTAPAGALALFDEWERLREESDLQAGDLEHAARHLFARLRRGGYASPATVATHLQAVPRALEAAALAWAALRSACQDSADLIAACDAYAARRDAQAQAEARMRDALHRLVWELAA